MSHYIAVDQSGLICGLGPTHEAAIADANQQSGYPDGIMTTADGEVTLRWTTYAAKCVVLDTWAGRRYYAVEVVGETPKKARIRVLTPGGVMLPNRRYVQCGEIALVPKHAIKDMPSDAHKIEQGYYNGHVEGFGGTVDAR